MFHEECEHTPNYDLSSMPGQSLIVLCTFHINVQAYFHKLKALIMYKHVHAMYNFIAMITHVYNTVLPITSLYCQC